MSLKKVHDDKWIVITGGAGFIGSAMVRHLNDLGFANIIIVDDLGDDLKWKNLVGKQFLEIVPIHELFEWLEGRHEDIQAFIHLGGCTDTSETDADYLLEINTRYSVRLCEYARRWKHRFIYASSAATYGDGALGFSDSHDLLPQLRPLNMYAYSKHLFDLWALRQGHFDNIVGLKLFNVFGPNEGHKGRSGSVVAKMVPQIEEEGIVRLFKSDDRLKFADGDQKRDFIYVKDVVRYVHAFLGNDLSGIYNIGSGQATSWNEVARGVFHALVKKDNIEYVDMPNGLAEQYQNYTCAETSKLIRAVDGKVTPLGDALADYINNYLLPGVVW